MEDLLNLSCTKKSLASLCIPSFIRGELDQLILVTHVQPSKLQILMQIQLKNKLMYAHVGSTMIKLARLSTPFVEKMMLTWWQHEWNVARHNACNCFCTMWKLKLRVMDVNASCILVYLLPWTWCKRWIPNGYHVHTHWGRLVIQGWGNSILVQNVVQKIAMTIKTQGWQGESTL